MQEQAVSKQLDENITWWKQQFSDCADIKMRSHVSGQGHEYPGIFKLY